MLGIPNSVDAFLINSLWILIYRVSYGSSNFLHHGFLNYPLCRLPLHRHINDPDKVIQIKWLQEAIYRSEVPGNLEKVCIA